MSNDTTAEVVYLDEYRSRRKPVPEEFKYNIAQRKRKREDKEQLEADRKSNNDKIIRSIRNGSLQRPPGS